MRRRIWIAAILVLIAGCRSNPARPTSFQKPGGPDSFSAGPDLTGPVMDLPPAGYPSHPVTGPQAGGIAMPPGAYQPQPQPYPYPYPQHPTPPATGQQPVPTPTPIPQGPMPRPVQPPGNPMTG